MICKDYSTLHFTTFCVSIQYFRRKKIAEITKKQTKNFVCFARIRGK